MELINGITSVLIPRAKQTGFGLLALMLQAGASFVLFSRSQGVQDMPCGMGKERGGLIEWNVQFARL